MPAQIEALARRLEHLEQANRRLRFGLVAVVGGLALSWVGGPWQVTAQEAAETIEARQFVVKDPDGQVRVRLGLTEYGPALGIHDAQGILRLSLHIADGGQRYRDTRGALVAATEIGLAVYPDDGSALGAFLGQRAVFRISNSTSTYVGPGWNLTLPAAAGGAARISLSVWR